MTIVVDWVGLGWMVYAFALGARAGYQYSEDSRTIAERKQRYARERQLGASERMRKAEEERNLAFALGRI